MCFFYLFRRKPVFFTVYCFLFFSGLSLDSFSQSYCTPSSSNCSDYQNFRIESVVFSNINNPSSCGANGYSNFTGSVPAAQVAAGTYVPMTVQVGSYNVTKVITVGIDFDKDGNFETDEIIKLGTKPNNSATISGMVRIPFNAPAGTTRMRIVVSYSQALAPLCSVTTYGEIEDYTVNISPAATPGPHFSFYVNKTATGSNTGMSWGNAFTELTTALEYAKGRDTIRVAKGTYKPGTVQASTFRIIDSLFIAGGYPNTGNPTDNDRNFSSNQTILSGDLNVLYSNVYTIIYANQSGNFTLDGFILEKSNNEALNLNAVQGAQIKNCVFRDNQGNLDGGIIRSVNSSPVITNSIFHENLKDYVQSGLIFKQNSNATLKNCVFAENNFGKSIINVSQSTCTIINSNFVNDTADNTILADSNSVLNISNSIFFNNIYLTNISDTAEIKLVNSVANINNTITQVYNYGNALLLAKDPKFRDTSKIAGPDNLYFTADDGLQLINPCSPAINTGSNAGLAGTADILGNARIFEGLADLGAYETQSALAAIPTTLYVNKLATGLNDGSSWANAFTDLQQALYYCSDTIKVAAGTYYPSSTDEKVSFWLQNKRVLLGGYPNTGNPADALRNPVLNQTLLSRTLSAPAAGFVPLAVVKARTVDSTAVLDGFFVTLGNPEFSVQPSGAIVATANANPQIRNCVISNNGKAATYFLNSSPRLINCTFENNTVSSVFKFSNARISNCIFKSTGISNENSNVIFDTCTFLKSPATAITNLNSNPVINTCKFIGNGTGYGNASGRASDMSNNNSNPIVSFSLFSDSTQRSYAGAIENINQSNGSYSNTIFNNCKAYYNGGVFLNDNSSPTFYKCVFRDSRSGQGGAAINNSNASNPVIKQCLFINNSITNIYNDNSNPEIFSSVFVNSSSLNAPVIANANSSVCKIYNSVFWGNENTNTEYNALTDITNISGATTIIKNSLTQTYGTNGTNGNIVANNPRFTDITNPAGPDGIFFTPDDGLALCNCSPAINTGSNSEAAGMATDVLNNPRVFNGTIDMGAYEYQSAALSSRKTYFVKASATGLNDGSTWQNAYKELKDAVQNPCADTIKVAAGTYKPSVNSRDSSFFINRGLHMYGGYPDTGAPSDSLRNTDRFLTILSGDIGVQGDSTDNVKSILRVHCKDTAVSITGFTFKYGNGSIANGLAGRGAGIYATANKKLLIYDCRFSNNTASFGGAVNIIGNTVVEKCVFENNYASRGNLWTKCVNTLIKNCVFNNNRANTYGGAVYGDNTTRPMSIQFENNVFYNNKGDYRAPGVYIDNNVSTVPTPYLRFINCTFVKNHALATAADAGKGTGLYYNNNTNQQLLLVVNSVFKNNLHNNTIVTAPGSDCYGASPAAVYLPFNIHHSATYTTSTYENSYISPNNVSFRNIDNAVGPDSLWFTEDDGLQPDGCSLSSDKGDNSLVTNIPGDILDSARIFNGTVDMGAYEYPGFFKPVVTITCSDSSISSGQLVTFKANAASTGTTPFYQWQVNEINVGSNSDTFSISTLSHNDKVSVILTGNPTCATGSVDTSNIITMSVDQFTGGRLAVELSNKSNNIYSISSPEQFLSTRAIERRLRNNISIDSTDLPIPPQYLDSIRLAGDVTILSVSKWLNKVLIETTDTEAIAKINNFSFVKRTTAIAPRNSTETTLQNKFEETQDISNSGDEIPSPDLANIYNYGQSYGQVHLQQGEFLHNHGFSGQGMQLAMLDAGFPNYNSLAVFDSVRINNQFLGTWDFVNNNVNVNGFNSHGTQCLSLIASHVPGTLVGTAPKTSFYLYRTEDAATEYPIEEHNMAAALERADSLGVDVASISLGYFHFTDPSLNYSYADMDGNTTISARAADLAAHKGMLVVVAAGNEGTSSWHYLLTPSDADSVLAVGAVDISGNPGNFSSYGPSSDGQVKPGVAAMGVAAVVANPFTGVPMTGNGTSFACPNMAGLATCLWQAFPESGNMDIISALQEAATMYNTPNDRVGYGIPDMKKAFVILLKRAYTQDIKQAGCNVSIKWTAKSSGNMNFVVERKLPADADYLPIHTQNGSGDFAGGSFSFTDDLTALAPPISISYRIKMNIDTDTSFYFTPVTVSHQNTCNTYTFTGNGNWNVAANWAGNNIPPANLPAGSTIIIDPVISGECILNTTQQIQAGAYFEVKAGKKLTIPGDLIIQ